MQTSLKQFKAYGKSCWRLIRRLSGDDAYERYLEHFAEYHQQEGELPLTRQAYFRQWQDNKWEGIKRCC